MVIKGKFNIICYDYSVIVIIINYYKESRGELDLQQSPYN